MRKEPRWLSKISVLAIHERLLAEYGGAAGIIDEGALEGALTAPTNRYLYEQADVFRLAATYAHAIIRDHLFSDGNKRVALTVAGVFLELNGYHLAASEGDAVAAICALVERKLDEPAFAAWLKTSCVQFPVGRQSRKSKPRPRPARPGGRTAK